MVHGFSTASPENTYRHALATNLLPVFSVCCRLPDFRYNGIRHPRIVTCLANELFHHVLYIAGNCVCPPFREVRVIRRGVDAYVEGVLSLGALESLRYAVAYDDDLWSQVAVQVACEDKNEQWRHR